MTLFQDNKEVEEEWSCCPFCPTADNGDFVWNPIIDQLICNKCERELFGTFVWPEFQGHIVDLYPPTVRSIMDMTGLSYRECQRIYLDHDISTLTQSIIEDDDEAIKVFIAPDGSEMSPTELLERIKSIRRRIRV